MLSSVDYFFLSPVWFSFKRRNSSETLFNLLFYTDVNNFPKQLKMVIGRTFLGSVFALFNKMVQCCLRAKYLEFYQS